MKKTCFTVLINKDGEGIATFALGAGKSRRPIGKVFIMIVHRDSGVWVHSSFFSEPSPGCPYSAPPYFSFV